MSRRFLEVKGRCLLARLHRLFEVEPLARRCQHTHILSSTLGFWPVGDSGKRNTAASGPTFQGKSTVVDLLTVGLHDSRSTWLKLVNPFMFWKIYVSKMYFASWLWLSPHVSFCWFKTIRWCWQKHVQNWFRYLLALAQRSITKLTTALNTFLCSHENIFDSIVYLETLCTHVI